MTAHRSTGGRHERERFSYRASEGSDMEYDLTRALGLLAAIVVVGVGGLLAGNVMAPGIVLMMVLPSMVVFALVAFALGVKHGEYRAAR